jgi:hypothetical protein
MGFHQGAFDESAVIDVINSQSSGQSLALPAGGVMPAGAITGSQDVFLINTTVTPGTVTTRTAAQMFADIQQQLGFAPPTGYVFFLTIVNQGTSTLTLAAGNGVTLGSGTNSVAANGANRTYLVTFTGTYLNPTFTIQTTGSGSA